MSGEASPAYVKAANLLTKDPSKVLERIVLDERWVRTDAGWDTRRCFRYEYTDGSHSWADILDDEDLQFFVKTPGV